MSDRKSSSFRARLASFLTGVPPHRFAIVDRGTFDNPIRPDWALDTDEFKLALSTVWSCVDLRARVISSLPSYIYRKVGKNREIVEKPPRWANPDRMPNPHETQMTLIHRLVTGLDLDGNAYLRILSRDRSMYPDALSNIQPQAVAHWRDETTNETVLRVGSAEYTRFTPDMRSGDVIWFKRFDRGGVRGLSPIEATPTAFDLGYSSQDAAKAFLDAGAGPPPGAFRVIGGAQEEIDEFVKELEARSQSSKRKFLMVLPEGVEWVEFSFNPITAQLLDSRKLSMQEICGIYGVPKQLLSMTETTWATGVNALITFFYVQSLLPTMRLIEEGLSHALPAGQRFKFDARGLLRADPKLRVEYYRNLLQYGAITRNEVRDEEDYNPIAGLDEPLVPISYGLEEQIKAIARQAVQDAKGEDQPEDEGGDDGE